MDMFAFKSEQLEMLFDMFDCCEWKAEVYIKGITRMHDCRNFDFIKRKIEFPSAVRSVYMRFGILNLFNPHRPNGSYRLDLSVYEERTVCKMLLELAKQEGFSQISKVILEGKEVPAVTKEFLDKLPDKGFFEGMYVCAPEN